MNKKTAMLRVSVAFLVAIDTATGFALPPVSSPSRHSSAMRLQMTTNMGSSVSRREMLRSCASSALLGGVTLQGANAWAEEKAEDSDSAEAEAPAPKPASKPKKPPAAEPVKVNNGYGAAISDPEDPMGLGIFGCKFWGLKRKEGSNSCENKK